MAKIKVLSVDDSALIRSVLREVINSQPDMEVIGQAPDPGGYAIGAKPGYRIWARWLG